MDKILETIIQLSDKPCCMRHRMLRRIIDTSTPSDFGLKDVHQIFEVCLNILTTSDVPFADQLAIFVYRNFGKRYPELLNTYFTQNKLEKTMKKNAGVKSIQRFVWIKESLVMLKNDEEALKKLKTVSDIF